MKYLEPTTLQVFIYFLYNDKKIDLLSLSDFERKKLIQDIDNNNLADLFSFTANDVYVINNTAKLTKVYNNFAPLPQREEVAPALKSIQKIIKFLMESSNASVISISDLINISSGLYVNYSLINKGFNINIIKSKKKELEKFIYKKYITNYEEDKLDSDKNFYPFEKNLSITLDIISKYLKIKNEFILSGCPERDLLKIDWDESLRFYDTIFYLLSIDCMEIKGAQFFYSNGKRFLQMNINWEGSIDELKKMVKPFNFDYGDLSFNSHTGIALYKSTQYTFRSGSKEFKVLLNLMENKGNKVDIYDLYNSIYPEEKDDNNIFIKKRKKESIVLAVAGIKRNLKISSDNPRSIDICINGDSLILKKNN